jgi:hypothetical protein
MVGNMEERKGGERERERENKRWGERGIGYWER